jgi:ribosome-binding protein aMBF1 (putative translation factor)
MDTAEMKLEMIQFITALQNEEEAFIAYAKIREAKMKVDEERGWLNQQNPNHGLNMGESILEHIESSKSTPFEKPVRMIEEWLK